MKGDIRNIDFEGQYVTLEKLVQVLEQQTVDSVNALEIALQASSRAIQLLPPQQPGRDEAVHDILVSSISNLPFKRACRASILRLS